MHCFYVYDWDTDLVALTAAAAAGRTWTVVMDRDEAHQLGEWACFGSIDAADLTLDDLRCAGHPDHRTRPGALRQSPARAALTRRGCPILAAPGVGGRWCRGFCLPRPVHPHNQGGSVHGKGRHRWHCGWVESSSTPARLRSAAPTTLAWPGYFPVPLPAGP